TLRRIFQMISIPSFDALLTAICQLPPDEQSDLIDVVRRRLLEQRRQEIIADVREAETEIAEGKSSATTAAEVIREITS
ncbi:MAG: hypothetical protein WCH77_14045, partial [Planctomycetota bacterium]